MVTLFKFLWPAPAKPSKAELEQYAKEDAAALKKISELRGFPPQELDAYQQTAQRIVDYETARKTGAESRATAYIAAIATLITLMTWALGNTTPLCSSPAMCRAWSAIFDLAIIYFVLAAYWSLKTLAVANFHTIGVEDVVEIKVQGRPIGRELLVQSLQLARANRDTINIKQDFVRTAQRCFFLGLFILAVLLALDPWFRLGAQPVQHPGAGVAEKPRPQPSAVTATPASTAGVSSPAAPDSAASGPRAAMASSPTGSASMAHK